DIIILVLLFFRIFPRISVVYNHLHGFAESTAALREVVRYITEARRHLDIAAPQKALPPWTDSIVLRGISFGYDAAPVLHDVSLTLRYGQKYLLQGINGSGKTTLADILVMLYQPQA